ncbi:MAG: hypothetical protein U0350_10130 [Caldilineaceae bacterium]
MRLPKQVAPVLRLPNPEKITTTIEPAQLGDLLGLACLACNAFPPGNDRNTCLQTCGAIAKTGGGVLETFLPFL